MRSLNIKIKIIFFALMIAGGGYLLYLYYCDRYIQEVPQNHYIAELRMRELLKSSEPTQTDKINGISYDFKQMLRLINTGSQVWGELEPSFESPNKNITIDYQYIATLLQELSHERARLTNYIWDLKGYSKSGIPIKEYRSLQYYLEVLDGHITHMKSLIKRRESK